MRKDFITLKLVATLDRRQLSIRDYVFILEAAIDAVGLNMSKYSRHKSSLQRILTKKWKERAENIKKLFSKAKY